MESQVSPSLIVYGVHVPPGPSVQARGALISAQNLQVQISQRQVVDPPDSLAGDNESNRGIAGHLLVEDGNAGAGEVWVLGVFDVEEAECCVGDAGG